MSRRFFFGVAVAPLAAAIAANSTLAPKSFSIELVSESANALFAGRWQIAPAGIERILKEDGRSWRHRDCGKRFDQGRPASARRALPP